LPTVSRIFAYRWPMRFLPGVDLLTADLTQEAIHQ
jgi:hypothetical protein